MELTEIPLSDFSNHLASGGGSADGRERERRAEAEWEQSLPFPMPVLSPSSSNEQPSTWSLNVTNIKSLPARLWSPPPPVGLPKLKRFTIIPEYDIPLSDILQDKHASPLSLREFEEYLLYVERSAENLYFHLWFQQYSQAYDAWDDRQPVELDSPRSSMTKIRVEGRRPSVPLARSFQRARHLFFDPESQYELNLTDDSIDPIRRLVKPGSGQNHKRRKEVWEEGSESDEQRDASFLSAEQNSTQYPRPRDLQRVKNEVEGMLKQSLTRFLQLAFTNAGRSHDKLGYGVFGVYIAAATAVSVSLIVNRRPRALRIVVAPLLLVAWSVLFSVMNGICPAIFFFGDARQLRPHEIFVMKCRMMSKVRVRLTVDYKQLGGSIGKNSADPIIPARATYRRTRTRGRGRMSLALERFRRIMPVPASKKRCPPRDLEGALSSSRPRPGDFGFRVEPELEYDGTAKGSGDTFDITSDSYYADDTPTPTLPTPAYIPNSSPLQLRKFHHHPPTPSSSAFGGFDLSALSPQPNRARRPPAPLPTPPDSETEFDDMDEEMFAREMGLELSDPNALGLYGPMVNIPSAIVRRAHWEIFSRSFWMAVAVTVPMMIVLLVIPVPS